MEANLIGKLLVSHESGNEPVNNLSDFRVTYYGYDYEGRSYSSLLKPMFYKAFI